MNKKKKFFLFSMALFIMSANALADELTATLQQGDNMQAFYGVDAFKQAYEAAENSGATITLSWGTFNPVDSIKKSITIIGYNGLDGSHSKTNVANMKILADNVKIEGIYFSGDVELGEISNCHIKRCYITYLKATKDHTNTFVEQSVIKEDYAVGVGLNYHINNSTLSCFRVSNTSSNKVYVTNCVIWYWYYVGSSNYTQPYGIYMNNVLGLRGANTSQGFISLYCPSYSEYYYNLFIKTVSSYISVKSFGYNSIQEGNVGYDDPLLYTKYFSQSEKFPADDLINTSLGMDGTPKGIYGGSGFTALPSIPRITSSTIDSCTDSEGKINVKISATVGPN